MARFRGATGFAALAALCALALLVACGDDDNAPEGPAPSLGTERPTATPAAATRAVTASPAPTPAPTASPGQRPAFDPAAFTCPGVPSPAIDREWQVSAPRGQPGPVRPGEVVELGLRNKFGAEGESYFAGARVIAPDGVSYVATASLSADAWAYVHYPGDFAGAVPLAPGVYTVVWEIDGGFIACDGFVVEPF